MAASLPATAAELLPHDWVGVHIPIARVLASRLLRLRLGSHRHPPKPAVGRVPAADCNGHRCAVSVCRRR